MWLLDEKTIELMKFTKRPSAEEQTKYAANSRRPLLGAGGNINIKGILTDTPDFWAFLFGGANTTYRDIIDAVKQAEQDNSVKEITLWIDSPGGQASAMWVQAMDTIYQASKPVKAIGTGLVASAAYGLGSQADTILALNRGVTFGSIGVVSSQYVSNDIVEVTSSNAPNKRPDAKTEEGQAVIRAEIDEIENIFIDAIARGRNTTSDIIKKDYGKGGVFLADKAINANMIDGYIQSKQKQKQEAKVMDKITLKNEHPALYASIIEDGVNKERDRVSAHLKRGRESGAVETAIKACIDGSSMTESLKADYDNAAIGKLKNEARVQDNVAVETPSTEDNESQDERVWDAYLNNMEVI